MLAFIVAPISVVVLYTEALIKWAHFLQRGPLAYVPVKTMLCPVFSVGKTFHTVCAELCIYSVEYSTVQYVCVWGSDVGGLREISIME